MIEKSTDGFRPLLSTTDWNEEWKELQRIRRHADDAAYWDKRSATFATKDAPNPYVDRFLELARIQPGESVFDMGCGTGALTVPLAAAGHRVTAADFSQGMLDKLREGLDGRGCARNATLVKMSWSDDWRAFGIAPDSADVALASRSIATADLRDSLMRLTEVARRRVCVTLSTGTSPRSDEGLLADLGIRGRLGYDYLYAFNILTNDGLRPEISYIESLRDDTFDSWEDARASLARMVEGALGAPEAYASAEAFEAERGRALSKLDDWLDANLVPNEDAGAPDRKGVPQGRLRTTRPRVISWAFISWDK